MKKQLINYETLLKVTKAISHSKDPEEVALITVESIKTALGTKGCALFLFNRKNNELKLATSYGLSDEYINKGPVGGQLLSALLEKYRHLIYCTRSVHLLLISEPRLLRFQVHFLILFFPF